mmetsp:Transcript_20909/g.49647  ORF Transcript_20909/g.49647 Transcript_20909/m.49647 type:complete len:103 (+) Transcript_20909:166-474(+)
MKSHYAEYRMCRDTCTGKSGRPVACFLHRIARSVEVQEEVQDQSKPPFRASARPRLKHARAAELACCVSLVVVIGSHSGPRAAAGSPMNSSWRNSLVLSQDL